MNQFAAAVNNKNNGMDAQIGFPGTQQGMINPQTLMYQNQLMYQVCKTTQIQNRLHRYRWRMLETECYTTKFCNQHSKIVTNFKSQAPRCHQHHCGKLLLALKIYIVIQKGILVRNSCPKFSKINFNNFRLFKTPLLLHIWFNNSNSSKFSFSNKLKPSCLLAIKKSPPTSLIFGHNDLNNSLAPLAIKNLVNLAVALQPRKIWTKCQKWDQTKEKWFFPMPKLNKQLLKQLKCTFQMKTWPRTIIFWDKSAKNQKVICQSSFLLPWRMLRSSPKTGV